MLLMEKPDETTSDDESDVTTARSVDIKDRHKV
jgi:hypothetical protein